MGPKAAITVSAGQVRTNSFAAAMSDQGFDRLSAAVKPRGVDDPADGLIRIPSPPVEQAAFQ